MQSEEELQLEASTLVDRLEELRGDRAVSTFAASSGMSESAMRKYLKGGMPGLDKASAIASANGVSLDWLASGDGPKSLDEKDAEFAYISNLRVEAAAGAGAAVEVEVVDDRMAFRKDWLRRHHLQEEHLFFITARGDSMEPAIRSGDTLLVRVFFHNEGTERAQKIVHGLDPQNQAGLEGIYVLRFDGGLVVKRLQPDNEGGYYVLSDSPEYEPLQKRADELVIIGRVEWIGRRI